MSNNKTNCYYVYCEWLGFVLIIPFKYTPCLYIIIKSNCDKLWFVFIFYFLYLLSVLVLNRCDSLTDAVAMDCEMVGVSSQGNKSALGRVTLVLFPYI